MKDKWHRKLPFVKVIKKGVLYLDQTSSVEEKEREKKDRKRKREIRKRQRKKEVQLLLVFNVRTTRGSTGPGVS